MKSRAQSSIEFIIIIGAMLFFLTTLLIVFQQRVAEKYQEEKDIALENVASSVAKEITFAISTSDGYERTFQVPQKVANTDYSIEIIQNTLYVKTSDEKNALALSIGNVTGQIQKGTNIIQKKGTTVFLNQ